MYMLYELKSFKKKQMTIKHKTLINIIATCFDLARSLSGWLKNILKKNI